MVCRWGVFWRGRRAHMTLQGHHMGFGMIWVSLVIRLVSLHSVMHTMYVQCAIQSSTCDTVWEVWQICTECHVPHNVGRLIVSNYVPVSINNWWEDALAMKAFISCIQNIFQFSLLYAADKGLCGQNVLQSVVDWYCYVIPHNQFAYIEERSNEPLQHYACATQCMQNGSTGEAVAWWGLSGINMNACNEMNCQKCAEACVCEAPC